MKRPPTVIARVSTSTKLMDAIDKVAEKNQVLGTETRTFNQILSDHIASK
jgi:hypothetical protein